MNKVRWSFSLVFTIFLVGILNTAAFASDPYNLKVVQKDLGLEVSFTGNSNDVTDAPGTQFDLVLKDGSTVLQTYSSKTLDSSNRGDYVIPSGDLTNGKVYTIELYHTSDTSHATLLSVASGLVIDNTHNSKKMYQSPDPHLDVNGSGLINANETGLNNTGKQRTGQNVHGAYQNNTNSCASCHQTHTAKDNNLLFKDGVYSTCSACHDGTTGAFNSFSSSTSSTPDSISGTFNVADDDAHGSIHQADGSLKITSAPGGNNDPNSKIWNQSFDCTSCHAPHGAGSADENNLNIDPLGWGGVQFYPVGATKADGTTATKDDANGKLFKNIPIYVKAEMPSTEDTPYILVKTTATADDVSADSTVNNYFWHRAGVMAGSNIIQTYRWDGTQYIPDYSLWLREKSYPFKADTALYNDFWSKLSLTAANHYNDTSKDITVSPTINIVWRDGFAWGVGVANIKSAQVSIGIDVETTDNIQSLYNKDFTGKDSKGKSIAYIPDSGVEMIKYCAACHTDYMTDPGTNKAGVLTGYHRHTDVTDELTCVRCHFAHGTRASIMKDSSDTLSVTEDTLSSTSHSSALRRYIDFTSCTTGGCHSEGAPGTSNKTNSSGTVSTNVKVNTTSTTGTNSSTSPSSTTSTSSTTNTSPTGTGDTTDTNSSPSELSTAASTSTAGTTGSSASGTTDTGSTAGTTTP